MNKNFLFIISAPSGCGKTTVCNELLRKNDDLSYSISVTTRKKRDYEVDGEHYHFLNEDEFLAKEQDGLFLETATIYDNHYGTLVSTVQTKMSDNKNVIFAINADGLDQIKNHKSNFNVVSVFLLPPSIAELQNRLHLRGDCADNISRRLSQVHNEIQNYKQYDYVLINNNLDKTIEYVNAIYLTNKIRSYRDNIESFIFSLV